MNNEIVFRLLLLILFISFVAHRGYYTRKFGRTERDSVAEREGGTWAARVANLLSVLALVSTAAYLINPTWMTWSSLPFPGWLHWVGVGTALVGFGLLQWSHNVLDNNWSDTPRLLKDQMLITGGPYQWIRHPIYTAFLLIMGAILLISANWFIGAAWLAATAIDVISRVRYEEKILAAQFGDKYRDYMGATGALLPKIIR